MNFTHYDLGSLRGGEIVEITIAGMAANVRLMDSSNFSSYGAGRRHTYIGGHATRSPVRLQIPRAGHWHVAVDLGGYAGRVRSSIRTLPGPLPPLREVSLSSVPSLVRSRADFLEDEQSADDQRTFDVFISYASEDKEAVVRPLALALEANGLRVWYDEFELRLGDSLRRKVDLGLARSSFGVVVLSQSFFKMGWPNYALDRLVTRSVIGGQVLLVWHNISKNEVMRYGPSLADKVARSRPVHTVEEIAAEIAAVVLDGRASSAAPR